MKHIILSVILLFCGWAQAYVISPTSLEVRFSYQAEFQTRDTKPAPDMLVKHAEFLFGYMQANGLTAGTGINHRTPGIGAPAWPPQLTVISESEVEGLRTIRYQAQGVMLINKAFAVQPLRTGQWEIFLPYDYDHYYDKDCATEDEDNTQDGFWYFYDPFKKHCDHLVQAPLAHSVMVAIAPAAPVDETLTADLETLRGDNGNGDGFEIVTVTGFNATKKKSDEGRVSFDQLNQWFLDQGFEKTVLKKFKDRPVFLFEKDFVNANGKTIHVKVTRLLAITDMDKKLVTFAKFFKDAMENADVVMYAGHSGSGATLEMKDIEAKAGPVHLNRSKQQVYFFDACTGYSYYLPLFDGRKDPGSLHVLTYALTSQFGFEHATHKAFFRYLLNFKDDHPSWTQMMIDIERSLRGMTFMLNLVEI